MPYKQCCSFLVRLGLLVLGVSYILFVVLPGYGFIGGGFTLLV